MDSTIAHDTEYLRLMEPDAKSTSQRRVRVRPTLRPHVAFVILLCSLVAIPMVAFTVALLGVIFVNVVDETTCIYSELCPGPDLINATSSNSFYINFPAARLALVSSFSSSISLALVGALMAMYAYIEARRIVSYSSGTQASGQYSPLNPDQFSILIRVLNADLLVLMELGVRKIRSVFGRKDRSGGQKAEDESSNVLRTSIAVLTFCVLGSVLIQAADAYFHVVAESLNLVQINSLQNSDHRYSRGLAPWCLNADSTGTTNNRHFWSCALQFNLTGNTMVLSNATEVSAVTIEKSTQSKIFNYTDANNVQYSIIGPQGVDLETDWTGFTYGVSTQCSPLPVDACTLGKYNVGSVRVPFECPKSLTGFEMSGNISPQNAFGHYLDWHRYLSEADYFDNITIAELNGADTNDTLELSKTLKDEDDNETFRNPWRWVNLAPLFDDLRNKNSSICEDQPLNWDIYLVACGYLMVSCNTTVWDITYGAMNHEVVWMNKSKSNGTVSGIASMANMPRYSLVLSEASRVANVEADSVESYVKLYESESSRSIITPLAGQTSPRAALLVQKRTSQIVTKLPFSALWLLVTANFLFVVLGFAMAILALMSGSADVHQVRSQLGISGLVAQLFGKQDCERSGRSDSDLLKEMSVDGGDLKRRVTVKVADKGNVRFELSR